MKGSVYSARLTSKGQITIPKKVRDRLGVREGEDIYFYEENGIFRIKRTVEKSPFEKWAGFLKGDKGERTDDIIEEMRGR